MDDTKNPTQAKSAITYLHKIEICCSEFLRLCSRCGDVINSGFLGNINNHMIKSHRHQLPQKVRDALSAIDNQQGGSAGSPTKASGLFQCNHCSESFNSGTDIRLHLAMVHDLTKDLALHYK